MLAPLPDPAALEPFAPAFRSTVSDDRGAFGIPHDTDTSMVLVNTDAAGAAGILYTLRVGLAFLQGQYATDYPTLMSGALLSPLPVLLFVVAQRSFVTGLARTGMK